jgi:hypothetical protein
MSRFKIIMLNMLAVFAFSATAASTASAHRVWTGPCVQINGEGIEPPPKFDNFECNTQTKPLKERKWQKVVPVGNTKALSIVKTGTFTLKAGTEEIACKKVTLTGGSIENVRVEGKGPTGRDNGTDVFTECSNPGKPECKVKEPIEVKGTTVLAETTGEPVKIVDVFLPAAGKELTPAEITAFEKEKAGKATTEQEKLHEYTKITQTGQPKCTAPETTAVEGDGVAAELSPGESFTNTLKFPATAITPVKLWNGLTITLKLKAFGVAATEVGEAEIELVSKEMFGVQ